MATTENIIIAGVDDATKCPCIGSIFIAGVTAHPKTTQQWKKLGIKDSKCVTRKKREKLAKIIKETALSYSIQEIKPAMIDNKTLNLNSWEMLIFLKIIEDLQQKFSIDFAFVDNWEVNPILFWQRLNSVLKKNVVPFINQKIDEEKIRRVQIIPEHQADEKYVVVGAASILAKTSSDTQYDEYKKLYGDFGSGNPGDPKTREFVWNQRKNPIHIIRQSWNTYKTLSQIESIEDDWLYKRRKERKVTAITK
jgi:ribonuclease HII